MNTKRSSDPCSVFVGMLSKLSPKQAMKHLPSIAVKLYDTKFFLDLNENRGGLTDFANK